MGEKLSENHQTFHVFRALYDMKYNNLPKTGNLFRLQQAHPTSSEHDPEGPGGVRAGFHTADQRGELGEF